MNLNNDMFINTNGCTTHRYNHEYRILSFTKSEQFDKEINTKLNLRKYGIQLRICPVWRTNENIDIEIILFQGLLKPSVLDLNLDLNKIDIVLKEVLGTYYQDVKQKDISQIIDSQNCIIHNNTLCVIHDTFRKKFYIYKKAVKAYGL